MVVLLVPGPPSVRTYTRSNTWNEVITVKTMPKNKEGAKSGTVEGIAHCGAEGHSGPCTPKMARMTESTRPLRVVRTKLHTTASATRGVSTGTKKTTRRTAGSGCTPLATGQRPKPGRR